MHVEIKLEGFEWEQLRAVAIAAGSSLDDYVLGLVLTDLGALVDPR